MHKKFTLIELFESLSPDGKISNILFLDGRTAGLSFNELYSDRSDSELRQLWSRQ